MGKRNSQRKKGSRYDSEDYDSVSSSSTSKSDPSLAQGIEDVQLDDGSILDQALDALHEKRGSTREKALSSIIEAFRSNLQHEFVENKFATLLHLCLNSIKRGSAKERSLACHAIGLLALTLGCGDNAHEILEESLPAFSQALKSPSESSSPLLECLAIITFVGGDDPEETERSMQIMWQLVHPALGSNVIARKPSAAVTATMVSSWSFLLTTMDKWNISSKDWKGSISYLSTLLDKDDRSVRLAAGEALALIFEMGNSEKFSIDAKSSTETSISGGKNPHIQGLKGNIINQVRNLSMEAGGKGITKKDLTNQRLLFRDILEFIEDGHCPDTSIKIGFDEMTTSTWHQMIQLNFLKHFLGGGFIKHMQDNEFLHEVFGFAPRKHFSKWDKQLLIRAAQAARAKERALELNKQRMFSRDMNIGIFDVDYDEEIDG